MGFKSWWDLSPAEREAFARKVEADNVSGWEGLQEAARQFGFEPTEDMPTVFELRNIKL